MSALRRIALVACALAWASSVWADATVSRGQEIYRNLCARCHGPNGEGVPGEYEELLEGDWPLEKLTRIIDRTMPEDDPALCKGEDANEVARFVYDAFYSREARASKQTARVELTRLTNRQYLNCIADLVGERMTVEDSERLEEAEHGLRAEYFSSRNPNRGRLVFARVDPGVHLDYGLNSPDPELIAPDEYSIRWRGSLVIEETGEYEIVLETGNGVRFWLNDREEPLIDASVASGGLTEHSARVRLLGGRAYPLRMDFIKSKGESGSIILAWKPPYGIREPIPRRHLSTWETKSTFVVATPFPPDDASVGYERGVLISRAWDEATTHAAIETANYVVKHLDQLADTTARAGDRMEKVRSFACRFGASAFRRPLTPEQQRWFVDSQLAGAENLEDALKRVILLVLKSPRFLYLGLGSETSDAPDDYEIASRLAFGLWDSLPDDTLTEAAAAGRLSTERQVRRQAGRMLKDPRAWAKVRQFLHHWLEISRAPDLSKDPELYPQFNGALIADLRASLDLFLKDAVWGEASDYQALLLDDAFYVNERLARFYGLATQPGDDFVKVSTSPGERSGVLTHPYLLAAFSYQRTSSPIHRGVFLTRNIVGRGLRPPPKAVEFNESEFDPKLTMREKVEELTRPDACRSCHSVINPLGFSLEHYDAVGRFRTTEGDRPIDASSEYTTIDGETVQLNGARDVAKFAANSEQAQRGFVEQLFHHVVKQPALAYGPDVLNVLRNAFADSRFNVRHLLIEISTTSALHGVEPRGASSN